MPKAGIRRRRWLDNITVSFMSFSPDSVKHLLESVPAAAVCQLVDDVNVAELREELGLGAYGRGAGQRHEGGPD